MEETQETLQEEQNEAIEETTVDTKKLEALRAQLRPEQNLLMGTLGGFTGAILGAFVWAGITVATGYVYAYAAVVIGYLVGTGMRILGKGIDPIFGYVGAILSLLGCLLGNFFSLVHYISKEVEATYMQMLASIDYSLVPDLLWQTSDFMTLIFYGFAVYEGYHFAFRKVNEKELAAS